VWTTRRTGTSYCYLLDTIFQQTVRPRRLDEIKAQVAACCPIDGH
jgi:hypothetical protein